MLYHSKYINQLTVVNYHYYVLYIDICAILFYS